jgi:hypothetical protein
MAAVESAVQENEDRDRQDMKTRLEVWDDDESDELFYVDRYVLPHLHLRTCLYQTFPGRNGEENDNAY